VAGVIGGGVVRNGTVVFAGTMPVSDELPFLDCDLATVPGATIDFGHDADDPVPYGTKVRVAQLGGSAVGELRFKAVNCCTPCSLDTSVENGFVYVRVKAGGTLVIFK